LLATARWPRLDPSIGDERAIDAFERARALVGAIRNLRGERQVAPRRRIGVVAPAGVREIIESAGGVVETLAGIDRVEAAEAAGHARSTGQVPLPFAGEEILLTGLVDAADSAGERDRLTKLISERRRAIDGYERKLNNAGYVDKAPPEVVAQTRQMLESARGDLAAAERSLSALGA